MATRGELERYERQKARREARVEDLRVKREAALARATVQLAMALSGDSRTVRLRFGKDNVTVDEAKEQFFPEEQKALNQADIVIDGIKTVIETDALLANPAKVNLLGLYE